MLKRCGISKYYARFDTHSYHSCRGTDVNASVDVLCHRSGKCWSRAQGHSACSKGKLRTLILYKVRLTAIIAAVKKT